MLRGEAGIGKSALLNATVDSAQDLSVIRLEGIESEMQLGYAALHRLLLPYLPRLERLPGPTSPRGRPRRRKGQDGPRKWRAPTI